MIVDNSDDDYVIGTDGDGLMIILKKKKSDVI